MAACTRPYVLLVVLAKRRFYEDGTDKQRTIEGLHPIICELCFACGFLFFSLTSSRRWEGYPLSKSSFFLSFLAKSWRRQNQLIVAIHRKKRRRKAEPLAKNIRLSCALAAGPTCGSVSEARRCAERHCTLHVQANLSTWYFIVLALIFFKVIFVLYDLNWKLYYMRSYIAVLKEALNAD